MPKMSEDISTNNSNPGTSDQESENEDINDEIQSCLQTYHPVKNTEEFFMLIAIILLSIGLVAMCLGYVIPRDYEFDASLPARQMEDIERHFQDLSFYLDVCILSGMGCIAAGGLIVTSVTMYTLFVAKPKVYRETDRQDLCLLDNGNTELTTYGTTSVSQ